MSGVIDLVNGVLELLMIVFFFTFLCRISYFNIFYFRIILSKISYL